MLRRNRQFLIAFLLTLGLVGRAFGSGSTEAVPSPLSTVLSTPGGTSYCIEFLGNSDGGYTWNYRVSELVGKDLGHWVLGLCATDPPIVVGWDPINSDLGISSMATAPPTSRIPIPAQPGKDRFAYTYL